MILAPGTQAPDFALPDQDGITHSLSDYLGKRVLLYFYPKDDTPGCTTEACALRDESAAYEAAGITVLGVSGDTVAKHATFRAKHQLPFALLSDTEHKMMEAYGAWGPKKFLGRTYQGVSRISYLIGAEGRIERAFEKVKPASHAREVLGA